MPKHCLDLEQAGKHIQGGACALGVSSGIQDAIKFLTEESGKAFAKRDDARAKMLREAADALLPLHQKQRQYYDEHLSIPCRDAFERLTHGQEILDGLPIEMQMQDAVALGLLENSQESTDH